MNKDKEQNVVEAVTFFCITTSILSAVMFGILAAVKALFGA